MARYIITGGLGTGKTSLIEHLGVELATVAEPARELIAEHRAATGEASLDGRPEVFVERLVQRSIQTYLSVDDAQVVLFDRGLPDCIAYAAVFGVDDQAAVVASREYRYETTVFVMPPWREIYTTDGMRRATFAQASAFYEEVLAAYDDLGYELVEVPPAPVADRAQFVRSRLGM